MEPQKKILTKMEIYWIWGLLNRGINTNTQTILVWMKGYWGCDLVLVWATPSYSNPLQTWRFALGVGDHSNVGTSFSPNWWSKCSNSYGSCPRPMFTNIVCFVDVDIAGRNQLDIQLRRRWVAKLGNRCLTFTFLSNDMYIDHQPLMEGFNLKEYSRVFSTYE